MAKPKEQQVNDDSVEEQQVNDNSVQEAKPELMPVEKQEFITPRKFHKSKGGVTTRSSFQDNR